MDDQPAIVVCNRHCALQLATLLLLENNRYLILW